MQDFNRQGQDALFRGLVQPTEAEAILNGPQSGYRLKQPRQIFWTEQFNKALEAFECNGFFVLIDHKQAESLDQEFTVDSRTEVSFIKLTMLVGG